MNHEPFLMFYKKKNYLLVRLVSSRRLVECTERLVLKRDKLVHFLGVETFRAVRGQSQGSRGSFDFLIRLIETKVRASSVREATIVCSRELTTINRHLIAR